MPSATSIHIPVDNLEIVDGPGLDDLKRTTKLLEGNPLRNPTLWFTFRSPASHATFRRKVGMNSVVLGYGDDLISSAVLVVQARAATTGEDISDLVPPLDTARFNGFLGDWFFSAEYDVRTRRGPAHRENLDDYLGYSD